MPADERALCPSPAQTLALGGIDGLLHNPRSPGHTVPVPPGLTRDEFLDRFALAVFRQQPLRVAASVARDSVRLFAPVRDDDPQVTPIARWQFQDFYPIYPRRYSMAFLTRLAHAHGSGGDLVAVQPAASFLRAYQLGGGYTPGPLYAVFLVAGVAGRAAAAHRAARALPAGDAGRGGAAGELGRVRVLLAVPAARRGAAAARRDAGGYRPGQGQSVPLRGTFRLIR